MWKRIVTLVLLIVLGLTISTFADEKTDRRRINDIFQKQRQGKELTDEEKQILQRAKRRQGSMRSLRKSSETTGLVPLTELGDQLYKGQTGGLYGDGHNEPPEKVRKAALEQISKIQPLDPNGNPSPDGQIVFISVGMSNTTQEFAAFKKLADADPNKFPKVEIVDCAIGGMAAHQWAYPDRLTKQGRPSPWRVMQMRLDRANVTAPQVQVAWLKLAQMMPARLGEFPDHAKTIQNDAAIILRELKKKFPNLHIVYHSSRIYGGYATTPLNPEPYAYEGAFAVRWLIEEQMAGKPELNFDPDAGPVKAPLTVWGPYLWGDGLNPRKSDQLIWKREDLMEDGTHPSPSGRQKVAKMLLDFLKTDPLTKPWFLKN